MRASPHERQGLTPVTETPPPGDPSPFLAPLQADPERLAVAAGDAHLTRRELSSAAAAYAAGLARLGIGPGDRVAVHLPASASHLIAIAGHLAAGIVHVPVNTRYREGEIRHVLRDSGAAALVTTPGSLALDVAAALRGGEMGPRIVVSHEGSAPPGGAVPFADLIEAGLRAAALPTAADPSATSLLVYTSGTTGPAKGVALTQQGLAANVGAITRLWRFTEADTLVLALPLFHVHGLCLGLLGSWLHGARVLLHDRFSAAAIVRAFREEGATLFTGVPTMYRLLIEHLEGAPDDARALASARLFTSGSAALPAADACAFSALTGHTILERYGMTETGFTISNPYDGERRPGSVGLPVPGYEVRIVAEDGRPCAAGELGEIVVRGDGLMHGYWNRAAETEPALRDGWFLTGDLATRDDDGYIRIAGRKSLDLVKSGGFKISAREIEETLAGHPSVAEAAVVAIPDPLWGERVAAVVVPRGERTEPDPDLAAELAEFVARRLADYKRPRSFRFVASLPRNAMGKVEKNKLRALFEGEPT
jgi:acyl-CoA synthetase (AMP-forming)/AMP-acid ligase II